MKRMVSFLITFTVLSSINLLANTVFEAEDANVISEAVFESKNAGFSGTGYINYNSVIGAYCEFWVSKSDSGNYTLLFYYANGSTSDRPMKISVNGVVIEASRSCPVTGAWTTWVADSLYVPLDSGLNTVKFETAGIDGPNLDKIEVSGEPGAFYYKLTFNQFGNGTVTPVSGDSIYSAGTDVTIIATPDSGYTFGG